MNDINREWHRQWCSAMSGMAACRDQDSREMARLRLENERLRKAIREAPCAMDDLEKAARAAIDAMERLGHDDETRIGWALRDLRAALEAEAGWIAVKDKLPPQHQDVWCHNRDGYQFQGRICTGMHEPFFTYPRGDGCPSNTAPSWIDVTHWRPLPGCPLREAGWETVATSSDLEQGHEHRLQRRPLREIAERLKQLADEELAR